MEHSIYAYWRKQSEVLKSILTDRARLTAPFVELYRSVGPDRIYLVGSGTSLNAENAARGLMEQLLGVEVTAVPSSRIDHLYGKNPLVMFISQGGSSTNTLEAMEKLKDYPYITLTGEEECEIKRRSKCHGLIGCGRELVGPKTVGYTASVMCFLVNALEAARAAGSIGEREYADCLLSLNLAAENMVENADAAEKWFAHNSADMTKIHKYVLVGAGAAGIAGAEGALKLQETIKDPCIAFEFEEYLHGPILMTDEKLGGLFFLVGEGEERLRIEELFRCHAQYSPYAYAVTDAQSDDPRMLTVKTTGQKHTLPFECVLAPQLMSARLPELMGIADGNEIYDVYTGRCPTKYENGR